METKNGKQALNKSNILRNQKLQMKEDHHGKHEQNNLKTFQLNNRCYIIYITTDIHISMENTDSGQTNVRRVEVL